MDGNSQVYSQAWGSPSVIAVPVGQEDRDFIGRGYGMRKGPSVLCHIRARIDDGHPLFPYQVCPGPIKGERAPVPGIDYPGIQGKPVLAALGGELLGELVSHLDDGGFVLGRERVRLHGVDVDDAVDVLTGPNQDGQLR